MVYKYGGVNAYWHHVGLFYAQFESLTDGYNSAADAADAIPLLDVFWMNVFGDLEDLEQAVAAGDEDIKPTHVFGSGSCSALIKLLPGNADLYASHDTWNSYQSMLRILKKYDLGFHVNANGAGRVVPGRVMSFSG